MAIRITKKGKAGGDWVGHCKTCGAEAVADRSDMGMIDRDPRDGSQWSWVKCPECGNGPVLSGMLFYPKHQ